MPRFPLNTCFYTTLPSAKNTARKNGPAKNTYSQIDGDIYLEMSEQKSELNGSQISAFSINVRLSPVDQR